MIIVNDDCRLMTDGKTYEGGVARNEAIMRWLRTNAHEMDEIRLGKNRFSNAIYLLCKLLWIKKQSVYFFYPTVGMPIQKNGILGAIARRLFFLILEKCARRNDITFDVCDLKYEQSIDLQIDAERRMALKECEHILFSLPLNFIFASDSMRNYAVDKYRIKRNRTSVIINGGIEKNPGNVKRKNGAIRFVYAGTLNRGRQIEEMLEMFPENERLQFYLLGVNGNWITEKSNVHYIGKLEETEAHRFVSQCDIGIIPYDSGRLYYNLAYPTKLSFYITAGISFLATPVKEVIKVHEEEHVGFIVPLKEWKHFFETVDMSDVLDDRRKIETISSKFLWTKICETNDMLQKLIMK